MSTPEQEDQPADASYLRDRLDGFLDLVAAHTPAPGGGSVAAIATALAASLVAMTARYSGEQLSGAEELVEDADRLRQRAADLADADADAYQAVLAAQLNRDGDSTDRREHIRATLRQASEVPLELAEIAAQTAQHAALLAVAGKPSVRADAATALLLADAAARSAAHLVRVNIESGGLDEELVRRAERCASSTREAVRGVPAIVT